MFGAKKYLYLITGLSFLTTSFSLHLWAEEGLKKVRSLELAKAESQQEQSSAQAQPQISFDSTSYNAGEVWEGDEVSHTFIVKNTGTAQLNISRVRPG